MKYACIERRRDDYPVRMMCRQLKVSASGYYAWRSRPESLRAKSDRELVPKIKQIHAASKGVYGSPRVTAELASEGYRVGRNRVARQMRLEQLKGCPRRHFRATTQRNLAHRAAKDLLQRDFTAALPNQRWVADITYIATSQGSIYLAIVMDLYSRRIVGWSMSQWMSRRIVVNALRMAIESRQPQHKLIHHSDRGAQYTSDDLRDELAKHGIEASMSGTGNCYDNAVAESFFGILKRERINRTSYRTREEARADVFEYIEVFYNRKRRHSYLGYISPVAFEQKAKGLSETVH